MAEPFCVYCRKRPADEAWRPFCSERCQVADLARWATGAYQVAGDPAPDADETENSKEKS